MKRFKQVLYSLAVVTVMVTTVHSHTVRHACDTDWAIASVFAVQFCMYEH